MKNRDGLCAVPVQINSNAQCGEELAGLRDDEVTRHGADKMPCIGWNGNGAAEYLFEGQVTAVLQLHVVVIVVQDRAVEGDAGEEALGAGVGEELGVELPVGPGLGVATDRTSRGCRVSADLELVPEHVLQALLVHGDENEVGGLTADLPAEAAARELDEDRSAPAARGAAGGDALAILRAEDEGAFLVAGNDNDAAGASQNGAGDALVRRCHDLLNDVSSVVEPLV